MPYPIPLEPPTADELLYPSSDGKPWGESTTHVKTIMLLYQALEDFTRPAGNVFLAADLFWYFEEGNPSAVMAPDVMVIKGIALRERRSYLAWKEGNIVPSVVFEVASEHTW